MRLCSASIAGGPIRSKLLRPASARELPALAPAARILDQTASVGSDTRGD
jgi:hypothetical protein